jgi:hypothetical protein
MINNKKLLFIGSESYDAPTITVIEGLNKLGWQIFTINKMNINSWFCNKVISENSSFPKFEFILSNLHWGTRWSLYEKLGLNSKLKVLIDGDDNPNYGNWKKKYEKYCSKYKLEPDEYIKKKLLSPYRWVEFMGEYKPDIVFSAQKNFKENNTIYIPFGIHDHYNQFSSSFNKIYTFTHFPGSGKNRKITKLLLKFLKHTYLINTNMWDQPARGESIVDRRIKYFTDNDQNIHSWHRWVMHKDYFDKLTKTKILIYPGIDHYPFWDSKRPWEAIASGAAVLMKEPSIDSKNFSLSEIDRDFVYRTNWELLEKIRYFKNLDTIDEKIAHFVQKVKKKFSSVSIAKYFLKKIGKYDN